MMGKERRLSRLATVLLMVWLFWGLSGCGGKEYHVDEGLGLGTSEETRRTDGMVYAVTDQNYAVIFELPNREKVDLSSFEADYEGVYLESSALDQAGRLASLSIGQKTVYAPVLAEQLESLSEFICPEDSLGSDWALTLEQVEEINSKRAGEGLRREITPSLRLCQAARARMSELRELYDINTRPDGRRGSSILQDMGIPYAYQLTSQGGGETAERFQTSLYAAALKVFYEYEGVTFSQIGLAVQNGTFDGQDRRVYVQICVLPEDPGKTVEGLHYEEVDGELHITGCDEDAQYINIPYEIMGRPVVKIRDDAFRNHSELICVNFQSKNYEVPRDLFDGCNNLRVVITDYHPDELAELELPEQCRVLTHGGPMVDDLEDPLPLFVFLAQEGAVYGYPLNYPVSWMGCVLLAVPAGVENFTVPESVYGRPVAYIHETALEKAPDLRQLVVPNWCAVAPELLTELMESEERDLVFQAGSMTDAVRWTLVLMERINQERAETGLAPVALNMTLTQMAYVRAQDMNEVTEEQRSGHQRPDGSSWISVLDSNDIPWLESLYGNTYQISESYQGIRTETAIESNLISQFAETYSDYEIDGVGTADLIGMGLCYGEYEGESAIFGVCVCGGIAGEAD